MTGEALGNRFGVMPGVGRLARSPTHKEPQPIREKLRMKIQGQNYETVWEVGEAIEVIDQRYLPHRFTTVRLRTVEDVGWAIREMVVRGAPLIGAVAGYGMALAATGKRTDPELLDAVQLLESARPTAVNLRWAVRYVLEAIQNRPRGTSSAEAAWAAARAIVHQERDRSRRIGEAGLAILRDLARQKNGAPLQVMTHCNAGWLATIDYGTATAPIYAACEAGIALHVWVSETRPRNQGAALTAFELAEQGVPHTVVSDNACGHLLQRRLVDVVIVGADRVAANGDTANKIGTYLKALAARAAQVPFYVALPTSTFDPNLPDGHGIPIEERSGDEVRFIDGLGPDGIQRVRLTPDASSAFNPAFDVTPADLISGFITEEGVVSPRQLAGRVQLP